MYAEQYTVTVVTGTATGSGQSPVVTGRILTIRYVKHGTLDYAAGVDFTITAERTGETIWTEQNVDASKTVAPRQGTHTTAGVAAVYIASGQAVNDYIWLVDDRVNIAIANGGDAKSGTFYITVG